MSSLSTNILRYLTSFIVVSISKKKKPAVLLLNIVPPNHYTGRMFHRSLCIAVINLYPNRPTNCPFSECKLLDYGLIRKKTLLHLALSQSSYCLTKANIFAVMAGIKQGFFAGLNAFGQIHKQDA